MNDFDVVTGPSTIIRPAATTAEPMPQAGQAPAAPAAEAGASRHRKAPVANPIRAPADRPPGR
jgi:hypothetical protein